MYSFFFSVICTVIQFSHRVIDSIFPINHRETVMFIGWNELGKRGGTKKNIDGRFNHVPMKWNPLVIVNYEIQSISIFDSIVINNFHESTYTFIQTIWRIFKRSISVEIQFLIHSRYPKTEMYCQCCCASRNRNTSVWIFTRNHSSSKD